MLKYQDINTGEILSEEQFNALSEIPTNQQIEQPKRLSFLERAKLSFGGPTQIEELKRKEEEAGLRGKLDLGDIADIAGTSLPTIGAVIGSSFGPIGTGVGAAGGEVIRRLGGKVLGVRPEETLASEAVGTAITGVATGVGAKAFGLVGKYLSSRLPKLLGLFTGETEVVSSALKNPKVADLGIKQGDLALRKAVQRGSEKTIQLRDTLFNSQSLAFKKIAEEYSKILSPKPELYKKEVVNTFNKLLESKGVQVSRAGNLNFSVSKIVANPGEISKIQNAYNALKQWDDFSLTGLNNYKQLIGKLTRFADEAGIPSKSPTLGTLYHSLDSLIKERLPKDLSVKYSVMNKRFSNTIDLYDDLVDAFNKGDPFTKLSQVFGKNKDSLRMLLDFYEKKTGTDIPALVAGRELAAERSAAFGFLNPREWIDLLIPPKIQAKAVTLTGRGQQLTKRFIPESIRGAIRGGVSEQTQRLFRQ